MTLLTIANDLGQNVGLERTDTVMLSQDREWQEVVTQSNLVGEELARRVDFGELTENVTLAGTPSGQQTYDLGNDFSRICHGIGVVHDGKAIRPLTRAEWASLTPVSGVPRYFLLEGQNITLWPYLTDADSVSVSYQRKSWCSNGTAAWADDGDTALIDEGLMTKGLIVRWRRQKGMDYADYEAEFEANLADIARFDDRSRL